MEGEKRECSELLTPIFYFCYNEIPLPEEEDNKK